ncbi:hypothetical protein FOB64_006125 [Candida albicans]|uniref:Uncharacterized protein n=1 Tax=Candida albicans TaxID=5476 RepID=A0A8H6BSE5_CANAX|nr:hypothetical protein FOB64_006125 [Candida albicans]
MSTGSSSSASSQVIAHPTPKRAYHQSTPPYSNGRGIGLGNSGGNYFGFNGNGNGLERTMSASPIKHLNKDKKSINYIDTSKINEKLNQFRLDGGKNSANTNNSSGGKNFRPGLQEMNQMVNKVFYLKHLISHQWHHHHHIVNMKVMEF